METLETVVGFIEIGGGGLLVWFWKRIQAKKEKLANMDKLLTDKNQVIQDLNNKINLLELELKLVKERTK